MQNSSRPATVYPVQNFNGCAPPPTAANANPNPYPYYPAPPHKDPRPVLTGLAVLLIFFATTGLIYCLVLSPQLPDFSVQSLSLSNFNASNQRVNATWNAQFHVSNPNKKHSVSYGDVVWWVYHRNYFLSETRIGPFVHGTRNASAVDGSYSVMDSFVDGKVVDEINGERSLGEMKFNLKVIAVATFRYGGWRVRIMDFRVWCHDVAVTVSSGKMTGGPKKCSVE